VGVECTNEPVEYVPVTVIVYIPAGVPLLPPPVLLLLLPQAIWKTRPLNSMQISDPAVSFPLLLLRLLRLAPKPAVVAANPINGRQSA
jgi:hypothetical protein